MKIAQCFLFNYKRYSYAVFTQQDLNEKVLSFPVICVVMTVLEKAISAFEVHALCFPW